MPLRDRSGQRWPPSGMPYVVAATEVCSRFIGTCWSLSIPGDERFSSCHVPSPAGLAPMEGIPMRAQAILHREILHVHALLDLTTTLLRTRLAILSPTFLACVTSPHLEVQIRGLDSAIRQATQAIHTGLHYTQAAELRGTTTFRDPRLPSPRPQIRPPASGSYSARGSTTTTITPDDGDTLTTRTPSTTRPSRGFVVATSTRPLSHAEIRATMNRSRSRSRPRLNPRDT